MISTETQTASKNPQGRNERSACGGPGRVYSSPEGTCPAAQAVEGEQILYNDSENEQEAVEATRENGGFQESRHLPFCVEYFLSCDHTTQY